MLIHVRTDPTLHGNAVSVDTGTQGYPIPRKVSYAGHTASLTAANRRKPDSTTISTSATSLKGSGVWMSKELQKSLRLPKTAVLRCNIDEEVWEIGPCLGVYVRPFHARQAKFGPQAALLKDLAELAVQMGIDLVVITPGFMKSHQGWRYNSSENKWNAEQIGFPDIVLRRSGAFKRTDSELVKHDLQSFSRMGRLHTLPRSYTNKWTMHQVLVRNRDVKPYLLDTHLATNADDVFALVHKYQDVYIKPPAGAQGHQIYHIQRRNGTLEIEWNTIGKTSSKELRRQSRICKNKNDFKQFWQSTSLKKCIVQKTFNLPRIEGKAPFDLRWLVQFTDGPAIAARMARVGQPYSVTTNIHTGGKPVEALELFEQLNWDKTSALIERLDKVAIDVAAEFKQKFGPIAELGVDLAVNEEGDLKIFEINSTPGRRMLKLTVPTVRTLSLRNLLEYAINATGFAGES